MTHTEAGTIRDAYSPEELATLLARIPRRVGWDFGPMKVVRQQRPWNYFKVVRAYLPESARVLDIGTGDGRIFSRLSGFFRSGLGIDPDPRMIEAARDMADAPNVNFLLDDARLRTISEKFGVITNHHALIDLGAAYAHLEPGGYFIAQQVGENNMACVKDAIGLGIVPPPVSKHEISSHGFRVVAFMEYDITFVVPDIDSLIFWFRALDPQHADIDGGQAIASADRLNRVLAGNVDHRGFVTNEHRYLVVAQSAL